MNKSFVAMCDREKLKGISRLTYESRFGGYGLNGDYTKFTIVNALGRYEDLGTVEEIS